MSQFKIITEITHTLAERLIEEVRALPVNPAKIQSRVTSPYDFTDWIQAREIFKSEDPSFRSIYLIIIHEIDGVARYFIGPFYQDLVDIDGTKVTYPKINMMVDRVHKFLKKQKVHQTVEQSYIDMALGMDGDK